ncbi:MAG: YbhB/YbcL family Raf kinase inhibitor-like protein [Candidatus Saccharimonadales bacterium]
MELTSPAFANNSPIPRKYTCKGEGVSPPLTVNGVPAGTQSLMLVVEDPDAPGGTFTHWTVWNISAATTLVREGSVPDSGLQGLNGFNKIGYGAPCPPSGTHRYFFKLYALNRELALQPGAHAYAVTASLEGHVLARAELVGLVSA